MAAEPVYRLYECEGLAVNETMLSAKQQVPACEPSIRGRIGYHISCQGHEMSCEDIRKIIDFRRLHDI